MLCCILLNRANNSEETDNYEEQRRGSNEIDDLEIYISQIKVIFEMRLQTQEEESPSQANVRRKLVLIKVVLKA